MKNKSRLLILGLCVSMFLFGCEENFSTSSSVRDTEQTSEADDTNTSEKDDEKDTEESEDMNQEKDAETSDDADKEADKDQDAEKDDDDSAKDAGEDEDKKPESGDSEEAAKAAYYELLCASPAMEDPDEVTVDASFSPEENFAKFGNHIDGFALIDINEDGIPELYTSTIINFRWHYKTVYTYKNGALVTLSTDGSEITFDECATANGAYYDYICEEGHIHSHWSGGMGDMEDEVALAFDGEKVSLIGCSVLESENATYLDEIMRSNVESERKDALNN